MSPLPTLTRRVLLFWMICILVGAWAGLVVAENAHAGGQRTIVVTGTHVGDSTTISGCGYQQSEVVVYLYRESDGATLAGGATVADGSRGLPVGCFSFPVGVVFTEAGAHEVEVFQLERSSHGSAGPGSYNENHPAAYLDFDVTP